MYTRWSQFPAFPTELERLRNEMQRALAPRAHRSRSAVTYPAVNLWENAASVFVETELPGLELSDLEIFVNGGDQLTIQGERKQPHDKEGVWHRQERGYGKFARIIQLPAAVDADHVTATYSDGVVTITLPKQEQAKPRRIEVKCE